MNEEIGAFVEAFEHAKKLWMELSEEQRNDLENNPAVVAFVTGVVRATQEPLNSQKQ